MDPSRIRIATVDDEPAIVDAIVLAFVADRVWRWAWPDPHTFLTNAPSFVRAYARAAILHDSAFCSDDLVAACLWLRPGVQGDEEAINELFRRTMAESVYADLLGTVDQMAQYHPREPYWYLPVIGVDPFHQGQGYGSALLRRALQECDREHLPAFLESSNPRNILLYRRHGFEVAGAIQSGASPTMVPMYRAAR